MLLEISQANKNNIALHYVSLDDLNDTFLDGNSKKHDTDKIIESILRYGFRDPIAFDPALNEGQGGIIEGNGRLEAITEMRSRNMNIPRGLKDNWAIPILFGVNSTTEEEAIAYSIEHNWSVLWGSDADLENMLSLFEEEALTEQLRILDQENSLPLSVDEDLDELLETLDFRAAEEGGTEQADPEAMPEPDEVETRVKLGQVWQLGKHQLYCGDSTDESKIKEFLGDRTIELLFTSPPYSDMRTYEDGTDISVEKIVSFIPCWNKFANYLVVNLGLKFKNHEIIPYWQEYIDTAKKAGLKMLAWNVWDKQQAGSVAHATNMFCLTHEWIFVFGTEAKKLYRTIPNQMDKYEDRHGSNILSEGRDLEVRQADGSMGQTTSKAYTHHQIHSVLNLYPELSNVRKSHPAVYPVKLPFSYIEAMTKPGDAIADCFLGSGTTLIAAEQSDRICYGCELSEHYCDVIIKRWEDFTGDTAVLAKTI